MRAATLAVAAAVTAVAGCTFLDKARPRPPAAGGPLEPRDAGRFVEYLNRQADRVRSVRYDDVSLAARDGDRSLPRLAEGTLACARPRYFRLTSGHVLTSGAEVDVGSNPAEFWMYVKRPEPTLVYCSHDDFDRGKASLPVPFEPAWVLEVLGMGSYPAGADYAVDVDQRNRVYTLAWDAAGGPGRPVRKAVVFAGDRAAGDRPQVVRHAVLGGGEVLAAAEVTEVQVAATPDGPVAVPTRVVLEWPPQKFRMELKLGRVRVNEPMSAKEQEYFFVRPDIPGARPVNLADAQFRPSSYRGAAPDGRRPRLFGRRW